MYLIPNKGRSIPDPDRGDFLPAEGRNVEPSSYWIRRLAANDVRKMKNHRPNREVTHNDRELQ
uniref:DUF2635 domain-containing protein n=1 Tax=Serratia quinivorans TaxID=137545 RepID=UPI0035C6BA69